jgi:nitroreductase
MVRAFRSQLVDDNVIAECVDLAMRAPSAGKSQGWNLLLLTGSETSRYWNITLPPEKREAFAFPDLLHAPCLALSIADPRAYLDRYSEDDKKKTGLGDSTQAWVAPYWTIDASFSTMTFLLALHDRGLGALFFAHSHESEIRHEFQIPDHVEILGALAFGYPLEEKRAGRSASRSRRGVSDIVHRSNW